MRRYALGSKSSRYGQVGTGALDAICGKTKRTSPSFIPSHHHVLELPCLLPGQCLRHSSSGTPCLLYRVDLDRHRQAVLYKHQRSIRYSVPRFCKVTIDALQRPPELGLYLGRSLSEAQWDFAG